MSDLDLERARRTLRAYGFHAVAGRSPCEDGGCPADGFVRAGAVELAGDLWMLEACGRCLRGRATRVDPEIPLPTSVACPEQVWIRRPTGQAHRVWRAGEHLRTACGHQLPWTDAPVWTMRHALWQVAPASLTKGRRALERCATCAGAQVHLGEVLADQEAIWDELVARAAEALTASEHAVPWAAHGR